MTTNKNHCKTGDWYGKPYYFFGDYLWRKYRTRILKLPISAGLSCPNRDGSLSGEGCLFCSEEGSASPTTFGIEGILHQMENARRSFRRSGAPTRYIAYFQAFSNTYAPPPVLKELYDTATAGEDIKGLMIATRPDCLPDEILNLIAGYRRDDFELWLEIGMQSMHEKSLLFLKRGHNHEATRDSIRKAAQRDIPVCVHVILGIPGETWEDMMATAREISTLPVSGVKFHHLHVIRGTGLDALYRLGEVPLMSFREYTSTVCDAMERLRPDILIHRLLGDTSVSALIAPGWGLHKGTVLKAIEDEFRRRCTHQGFLYGG